MMLLSILSDKKEADVTEISYIRSIWHVAPKKISLESSGDIRVAKDNIDKLARIHTAKF